MDLNNYIETIYREINLNINYEYIELYKDFENEKLIEIFSTLHAALINNYKLMNTRLPTNDSCSHFWAEPSRELIRIIDIIRGMERTLKNTKYAFFLEQYYNEILINSEKFLSMSGGSEIPSNMEKVDLYYLIPIFLKNTVIKIDNRNENIFFDLKLIGEGSYAKVFKYKDKFYDKKFALKKAKDDLNDKEIIRFKQEYEVLKNLSSPYIVEVYSYNETTKEYIMEYMDYSLYNYIKHKNNSINIAIRKNIINQFLKGFKYMHSKGYLHRDINPNNILLKEYEDILVVKISDFGLIKTPNSQLTSITTELKGAYNDPQLLMDGFENYKIEHEMYAITRLIYFVLTGRENVNKIENEKYRKFVEKGLSAEKSKRFKNVDEIIEYIKLI